MKKDGCMACYGNDKEPAGPAFKEVMAKYKSDADASAMPAKHVREGSKDAWDSTAMPPQAKINDDDFKAVIACMLNQ